MTDEPGTGGFAVRFPARTEVAADIRHRLGAWLHVHYLAPKLVADILLAASELIDNAIEHGYRDRRPGVVRLTARLGDDQLVLRVADAGTWKPRAVQPSTDRYGLVVLRALADSLTIENTDLGTRVTAGFCLRAAS